jgi:hypothetical protein
MIKLAITRPVNAAPAGARGCQSLGGKRPWRRMPLLVVGTSLAAMAFPASASAHGIVGKANLPIPLWLFSWAAAVVLVASFVALASLWSRPQLQEQHARALFRLPAAASWLAGLIGVALFALVVYSGYAGAQIATANFSVTFIYVIFWVGMPVLSVLFGDIFGALSPWRTVMHVILALRRSLWGARQTGPLLRYPAWLGNWPAIGCLLGFGWLELVYTLPDRDNPSTLASLSLAYFTLMLAGMVLFGEREWSERADGFGVYFNLLGRLSPLTRDEHGTVCLRRPLSGITGLPMRRGTAALMCALIGITTFDGASNGGIWRKLEPGLASAFTSLGLHATPAQELAFSVGLAACVLLIGAVYRLGVLGVRSVSSRYDIGQLTRTFAHTLAPIGFAYVLAHYFSLLIWQGQAMGYLISDPLGDGSNIFGTSAYQIDYQIISYAAIWYVQVAALVLGHIGGLALAHDRALVIYRNSQEAIRSQYWMLVVMVTFTSFGLWLLSAVGT